jgi:microcompartment protein CcmK/EutM
VQADYAGRGDPGNTILALDSVDAGVGDTVLIVQEGWGARLQRPEKRERQSDSAIVGVVDRIDLWRDSCANCSLRPQ